MVFVMFIWEVLYVLGGELRYEILVDCLRYLMYLSGKVVSLE